MESLPTIIADDDQNNAPRTSYMVSLMISQASIPRAKHYDKSTAFFALLTCGDFKRQTKTISNDLKPKFSSRFDINMADEIPDGFTIEIFDASILETPELVDKMTYTFTPDDYVEHHEANVWIHMDHGGMIQLTVFCAKEEGVSSDMITMRKEISESRGLMTITIGAVADVVLEKNGRLHGLSPISWMKKKLGSHSDSSTPLCFLVLELGDSAFRTENQPLTEAVFNQTCRFWVSYQTESPILRISLFVNGNLSGRAYIAFGGLIEKGGVIKSTVSFEQTAADVISDKDAKKLINKAYRDSSSAVISPVLAGVGSPTVEHSNVNEDHANLQRVDTLNSGVLDYTMQFNLSADLEEWFLTRLLDEFDSDRNGVLSDVEFEAAMEAIDCNVDDLSTVFKELDIDGNGTLDKNEILAYLRSPAFVCRPMTYSLLSFLADGKMGLDRLIHSTYSNVSSYTQANGKNILAVQDGDRVKTGLLMVQDRKSGLLVEEHIPKFVKIALNIMYRDSLGQKLIHRHRVNQLLKSMSEREGRRMDDKSSQKNIWKFVQEHDLNIDELLLPLDESCSNYPNFNAFFARKLKPEARPIAYPEDGRILVSPADCRMMAFDSVHRATSMWIKGKAFTVADLITPSFADVLPKFDGGSLCIARLAPQDYHRWHFPATGKLGRRLQVDGPLYTVNPVAVRQPLDVYTLNKREVCELHTEEFGLVIMVCIGATMVGSVNITVEDESEIKKGDEHGYFAFGGSTVIMLFEKDRVVFDQDLLIAASRPVETLVSVGTTIGRATISE
eukprot:CFRG6788T1